MRRVSLPASLAAALVVVTLAGVAAAGPVSSSSSSSPASTVPSALEAALQAAITATRVGRFDVVVARLDEARLEASRARGLAIDVATVTLGPHRGLGVYEAVPGGVVPGRALHLYLEVDGVLPKAEADGRFRHELDVSARFLVVGPAGDEVLGDKALGRHSVVAHRAMPLQAVGADVVLGTAPAGAYAAEVTVTDVATNKNATRRVAFSLR